MSSSSPQELAALQRALYESRNPTRRWLHTTRRDRVLAAIRTANSFRWRALEVGPGSGVYLPALCAMYDEVTAVDVEAGHIDALRELEAAHSNLNLVQADLTETRWTQPFDLVLCSEVIEHAPNPEAIMEGLSRATAAGGLLVLSTPQPWSVMEVVCRVGLSPAAIGLVRRIYKEPVLPTGHISLLARARVLALLKAHGFHVVHSEAFGLYLPFVAEFGGQRAVSFASVGERVLRSVGASWLLWTQLFIARKE